MHRAFAAASALILLSASSTHGSEQVHNPAPWPGPNARQPDAEWWVHGPDPGRMPTCGPPRREVDSSSERRGNPRPSTRPVGIVATSSGHLASSPDSSPGSERAPGVISLCRPRGLGAGRVHYRRRNRPALPRLPCRADLLLSGTEAPSRLRLR